jgi:hypothetical protein
VSVSNIVGIEPVMAGEVPIGVEVTFRTRRGTRTYFYDGISIAVAILAGEDPIRYAGTLIETNEI